MPTSAGTSKVADLASKVWKTLIEVKWIGRPNRWKRVVDEIRVDIQSYGAHPDCKLLFFVVIDAVRDIPDPALLQKELTLEQTISGQRMRVFTFIRDL
jgi:hypothetical protein